MSEEIKNEETKVEETKCKCCECREKFVKGAKEFLFKAAVVYVGVTLAIITAANVVKPPKCPCKMMKHHPGFERQMPPRDFHRGFDNVKGYHVEYKIKRQDNGIGRKRLGPDAAPNRQHVKAPAAPKDAK